MKRSAAGSAHKRTKALKKFIPLLITIAIYVIVYILMMNGRISRSMQSLAVKMCYNAILAVSLNLVVGFLGELSLGHAGFYALGAYGGCIAALSVNASIQVKFLVGLLVGGIIAAIGGFLISSSILRLRGDYLAIVTLAFGEIIRAIVKILPFTGGTAGLTGIPSFSKTEAFTWAFAILLITMILVINFTDSRHGRAVTAIRDNAIAAESVGINIKKYKVLVFTISSFFAGLAGVIFGFYKTIVEPADFDYNVSIEILVMVVLGGMGSMYGAAIAACIITALPELLRDADKYRMLIYAIALIVLMLLNASPKFVAFRERVKESVKSIFRKSSHKQKTEEEVA